MTEVVIPQPAADPGGLVRRWRGLVGRIGVAVAPSDGVLGLLASCYSEPHRRYHTLHHVADVLAHVEHLVEAADVVEDREALELAVWWHDAVYLPGAADNEERSAAMAAKALAALGVGTRRIARTVSLVEATAGHRPSGGDVDILLDADLAVLGRQWPRYLCYARQIRAEFGTIPDARYRQGRVAVLRGLLDRPRAYATPMMRQACAVRMRANLREEIRRLSDVALPVDEALRDAGPGPGRDC